MLKTGYIIIPTIVTATAANFTLADNYPYECRSMINFEENIQEEDFLAHESSSILLDYFNQLQAVRYKEKLTSIKALEEGWDGYQASIISNKVIENVQEVLSKMPDSYFSELKEENILPTPNGTVTLEWESPEGTYLLLDIGVNTLTIYLSYSDDNIFSKEKFPVNQISTADLKELLSAVYS